MSLYNSLTSLDSARKRNSDVERVFRCLDNRSIIHYLVICINLLFFLEKAGFPEQTAKEKYYYQPTMSNFINTTPSTMSKEYPAPSQSTTAKESPSKVAKFRTAQKPKVEERYWPLPRQQSRFYPLTVRPSTPVSLSPVIAAAAAETDPEHLALEDDAEKNVAEFQKALNLIPKIWLWRVMQTKTWQNS
ncbi:uncharacterized protein PAC_20207 [Phialocephala subalpina]|uniref:Uncharacterized protein n=1 Tax=Phialocephala subalpina TaxID=576137 RepID=A0A1L7XDX2_9HELO|nr:uncharacterized protein PAC_20207 [Phialocephala subalpina]